MSDKVPLLDDNRDNDSGRSDSVVRQRTNRKNSEKKSSLVSAAPSFGKDGVTKSIKKKTHFNRFVDEYGNDNVKGSDDVDRKASFDADLEDDHFDSDGDTEHDRKRHFKVKANAKKRMIYLAKKMAPDSLLVKIIEVCYNR